MHLSVPRHPVAAAQQQRPEAMVRSYRMADVVWRQGPRAHTRACLAASLPIVEHPPWAQEVATGQLKPETRVGKSMRLSREYGTREGREQKRATLNSSAWTQ